MLKSCDHNIETLMNMARNGDSEAFGVIYEKLFLRIYKYIFCYIKNKEIAEDIAQTVFLKAFKIIENNKETKNNPTPYFYKIAKNLIIDFWRKKKDLALEELNNTGNVDNSNIYNLNDKIDASAMSSRVISCIGSLSDEQKEIITLKFISGFSNKEIASLTGKKEDAIRQIQSRGLKSLRNILKSSYDQK